MSTDEAARTDEQGTRECGRCRHARPYLLRAFISNAHDEMWIECRRDGLGNERHWRAGAWDGVALLCDDYEPAAGAGPGEQGD